MISEYCTYVNQLCYFFMFYNPRKAHIRVYKLADLQQLASTCNLFECTLCELDYCTNEKENKYHQQFSSPEIAVVPLRYNTLE